MYTHLCEPQLDASLFEGLGKLLQLLQVAGFLQTRRVQAFGRSLAVGEGLGGRVCYRTGRGRWLQGKYVGLMIIIMAELHP